MGLEIGIVGLPNAGKSTLFNALAEGRATVAGYPFSTVDPNAGIVHLADPRLAEVSSKAECSKTVPATIRFTDIAGLVEGAHRGEGLGNRFLSHIREVDAVAHTVRCFEDPDVAHVAAALDPSRDIAVVDTELALADLETLDKRLDKVARAVRTGDKEKQAELEVLERARAALDQGRPVRGLGLEEKERGYLDDLFLLTAKPVIFVANLGEESLPDGGPHLAAVRERAAAEGAEVVAFCAKLEAELEELEPEDLADFLAGYGIEELGLHKLVAASFRLLDLVTFFTVESRECRAWPVRRGTRAAPAAGKIHTDMERGFIRAEVLSFEEFLEHGSFSAAREAGHLRAEGRDYEVRDGDVIRFRFN